jgi:transcriptional regulator with PAS, ATPase and Fis domain
MVRQQAGSPTEFSIVDNRHPQQFTADFLRRVLDALPESLVVIDRQRNIVMANREALREQTSLKCYQCFHHNEHACSDVSCPVECVLDSKGQVRVYHTHFDRSDREVSVSIDAAPIFDDQGEVAYIIEACRDVTERTLSRRLSRIGNRHIAMKPLLTEFTDEIRRFTCCSHVALYPYNESAVSDADGVVDRDDSAAGAVFVSARRHDAKPNCSRLLHPDLRPFCRR